MPWIKVTPIIKPEMRDLCRAKYPNHPHGCPNYGKKKGCPPGAPLFTDVFDVDDVYAVYNDYPLGWHMARMREAHPGWTERQLRNPLYWQGTARKQLKVEIGRFLGAYHSAGFHIAPTPEAMGIDVTATMASAGITLDWPPMECAYQVVLAARFRSCYGAHLFERCLRKQ